MRRAVAMASVAGIGAVGGLLVPSALQGAAQGLSTPVGTLSPRALLPTALPAVPPAAPRLAFAAESSATTPDSAADLWDVVASDGSDSRVVLESFATGSNGYGGPSYAPDGSRAVVASVAEDGDGQRLVVVEASEPPGGPVPLDPGWTPGTWDDEPDWSPLGNLVAFTREVAEADGEGFDTRLRLVDEETGLVSDPVADSGIDYEAIVGDLDVAAPAFAPDGSRIVFVAQEEGEAGPLWVLDLDAAALSAVTTSDGEPATGQGPAWSPDGSQLAYVDPEREGALVTGEVGDVVGPGLPIEDEVRYATPVDDELLLPGLRDLRDPAWSPDGGEIAVRATDFRGGEEFVEGIYAVGGGGTYRSVTDGGTGGWSAIEDPAYQPWSDLSVTLAAPTTIDVGSETDLTVTVTNAGPSPAWGTQVELELPGAEQGVGAAVDVPDECAVVAGGLLSCTVPEPLPPDETVELTVTVTLEQPGRYPTDARVTAAGPDPLTADNLTTVALDVPHPAALGTEPRLAFSYGYDDAGGFQADVADVLAADGSDFRLLVAEQVEDDDGGSHRPEERHPSYSPDGRRVVLSGQHTLEGGGGEWAFGWQGSLLVADVGPGPGGATNVQPLTEPGAAGFHDTDPVWSPDGTRIAFRRGMGDTSPSLAVVDPDTGEIGTLGPPAWEDAEVGEAAWSPDGQRLVVSVGDGEGVALWVLHVDDDVAFPVVTEVEDCGTLPSPCLGPVSGEDPAWSPDGTRLAFEDDYATAGGIAVTGIATVPIAPAPTAGSGYVVEAPQRIAGTDVTDPDQEPPEDDRFLADPTWAPDSGTVAFVGERAQQDVILTVPATGGTPEVLVADVRGAGAFQLADPVYQPWADVAVTLTAATPVGTDRSFALRATVTNDGPAPAWDTTVEIELPALAADSAVLESWPAGCRPVAGGLVCTLQPALPVDEPVTVEVTLRVTEPGNHAAGATVTTGSVDPEPGNDTAATTLAVRELPAGGLEPRLAFTRQADQQPDDSLDVADVPATGGPHELARLLAHQSVTTADGVVLYPDESHPSYSPDGTTLVFSATAAEGEDATARLAAGDLVLGPLPAGQPALTNLRLLEHPVEDGADDMQPAWSPDGTQVAFTRDEGFAPLVHLLDVASGQVRPVELPEDVGFASSDPSWSPDGARLAVQVAGTTEDDELWVVHLDPDTWYPVGATEPDCSGTPQECFAPSWGTTPAWSPDGTQIAVVDTDVFDGGPGGPSAILVHDVPDEPGESGYPVSGSRTLTGTPWDHDGEVPPGQLAAAWHPAWSPDGTEISFIGRDTDDVEAVYAIPSAGGTPEPRVAEWNVQQTGRYADPAYQPAADVSLTLTVPGGDIVAGEPFRMVAAVTNDGPSSAWGVTMRLDLPPGLDPLTWPPACTRDGAALSCAGLGPVLPGEQHEVTVVARPATAGGHTVIGDATTTTLDPQPGNNTDVLEVDAAPAVPAAGVEPRLAFTWTADREHYLPDVADVFWADGADFRMVADERVVDPGSSRWSAERHPSYSPDGRRMVFSTVVYPGPTDPSDLPLGLQGRLMVGRTLPGATGLVDVAPLDYESDAAASDDEAAWSPDGSRIAFVRTSDDAARLAVVDVAGGQVRIVTAAIGEHDLPSTIGEPTWSPDGRRLAVADRESGDLWVVHPDGDAAYPVLVAGTALGGSAPSWSPDGTRLAYATEYGTAADELVSGLFTVELPTAPDAGAYRVPSPLRLAGAPPDGDEPLGEGDIRQVAGPDWSLDSTSLAFVGTDGERDVIYTVPAAGGTPEVLRDEVREGALHGFADLEYQPWADVGVGVTVTPEQAGVGEPVDVIVAVTNEGPSPAWGVEVEIDLPPGTDLVRALPAGCVAADLLVTCAGDEATAAGATRTHVLTLAAGTPGDYVPAAHVTSRSVDPNPENDDAAARFRGVDASGAAADLAVSLGLAQPTGWVGGDAVAATVVVTNTGPGEAPGATLTLTLPVQVTSEDACAVVGGCALDPLAPGASRTVVVELIPAEPGEGTVIATVSATTPDPVSANDTASAAVEVLQPELRLLPSVGPPGEATLAYGTDFPPGAQLTLRWSRGMTPWNRPVTVAADGTVRAPMLVLPGDELGERLLTATAGPGPGFGEVEAPPMLVVPRSSSPPDFLSRG